MYNMFVDSMYFIGPFLLFSHINSYQLTTRTEEKKITMQLHSFNRSNNTSMYNVFIDFVTKLTFPFFGNLLNKNHKAFFKIENTDIKTISLFH